MTFAFFRHSLIALALTAFPALNASAGEALSLRGFGTLGAVWNSTDKAGFRRDTMQPDGPRGDLEWRTDTRLGLQLSTPTDATWSATTQALSSYTHDGSFDPELTWAFLSYQPNETLKLRAGRLGWDVYMLADSRHVGYANMWARPPAEFFGPLQLYSFDGLDAMITRPFGNGVFQAKVFGGEGEHEVALNQDLHVEVDVPQLAGLNLNYKTRDWQFRLGHTRLELEIGLRGSITVPSPVENAPPFSFSLDNLPDSEVDAGFSTAGFLGYQGPWEFQLMYAYTQSSDDEIVPSFDGAYLSAGYRMGKWMPYATYSTASVKGENQESEVAGEVGNVLGDVDVSSFPGQHTFSIGTRYDFRENMALKLQVDRIHAREYMFWTDVDSDWDGQATVVTATLDFIF